MRCRRTSDRRSPPPARREPRQIDEGAIRAQGSIYATRPTRPLPQTKSAVGATRVVLSGMPQATQELAILFPPEWILSMNPRTSRRSTHPASCAQTSGSIRTRSSGRTPTCSLSQSEAERFLAADPHRRERAGLVRQPEPACLAVAEGEGGSSPRSSTSSSTAAIWNAASPAYAANGPLVGGFLAVLAPSSPALLPFSPSTRSFRPVPAGRRPRSPKSDFLSLKCAKPYASASSAWA
jgi:hypothetical protein